MKARRQNFLLAAPAALALVASCASIPAPPQAGAPGGHARPRWTGGGEAQIYPAGVVAAVFAERTLSERDSLLLRGGYNATERGDFGEHDDESGGGPGFGLAYRHAFAPGRADGWFAGARVDLWFLEVDWKDDPSPSAPGGRSGSSDVVVLQPAAEGGYGWWYDSGRLDLTLTLGAEINVDTDGEDVGEGAILLAGVRYSLQRPDRTRAALAAQRDDADLLPDAASEVLTSFDDEGGSFQLTREYPDRGDCLVCHTSAAGRGPRAGLRTRQLNGDFEYPEVSDDQLRAWNHIPLFTSDIGQPGYHGASPRFPGTGAEGPAALARACLVVDCAHCRRPGGPTPVSIDPRYGIPTPSAGVVNVVPSAGDPGLANPLLVLPGNKELSVLWERVRVLDANRVPPIGSHLVDGAAVDASGQSIDEGAD